MRVLAELSHARSERRGALWIKKFVYLKVDFPLRRNFNVLTYVLNFTRVNEIEATSRRI